MTLLIASILADSVEEMRARALHALEGGADLVELRLDALNATNDQIRTMAATLPSGRWIATCRPVSEGGRFTGALEHRLGRLFACASLPDSFVDFEYANWSGRGASALARHDLLRLPSGSTPDAVPASLILSHHALDGRPANLDALVERMGAVEEATAVKIVWPADDAVSIFEAFELMRRGAKELIAICLGEAGLPSRLLARKFGAFATYCAPAPGLETAEGQPTLAEMLEDYDWERIDESSHVYGVIGCPVRHSLSPAMFNRVFAQAGVHGVYVPFLVEPSFEALAAFLDRCLECDWFEAVGFSVTLAHKEHARRYLADRIDPPADEIGAVNTLRFEDGQIWGCNTDGDGALEALSRGMGCTSADLEGLPVDLLGAGGASRAVVAGLVSCGCDVTVYNRDGERGRRLVDDFGVAAHPWDDRTRGHGKVLINCTNVGMWPEVDDTPMPAESLARWEVVFDVVYRPRETRLLREARSAGCRVIPGAAMFVAQAALQFEYWTQQAADFRLFARIVDELLARESPA